MAKAQKPRREFGNARKLPSGRWQAFYRLDGQRHKAERTFRTKTEATDYLRTAGADALRGQRVDPEAGRVLFKEYAEKWLRHRRDDPREPLAATTHAKYRRLLDNYVLDEFGKRQLGQITSGQVQEWYDGIAREHLSTAAGAYRLLATIFNTAIKVDEILARSPCKVKGGSREPVSERPTATPAEVQAALEATPEQYRAAFILGAWCQLRRSEILGLQRQDIATAKGTVRIARAWTLTSEGKTNIGPPKSDASCRTLNMPPDVTEAVVAHLERFVGADRGAWLFERNGLPVHPRTFERVWDRARVAAGRPDLHLHDLRHSGLTWSAATGATLAELMYRAGHSSPAAALRYQHAEDERDKALAGALPPLAGK
jgi:integrase